MQDADILIKKLKMINHPEGGHYVEIFKDKNVGLIMSGGNIDLNNLPWKS